MSYPWHYQVKDRIGPVSVDPDKNSSIKLQKVNHGISANRWVILIH
jgi:hypothetical protein